MSDLFNSYPVKPGYQDRDTSKDAAARVSKVTETHQLILFAMETFGDFTMHQMAEHLKLEFRKVQPRMSELAAQGKIFDSGKRELTPYNRKAIVWMVK